MLLQPRRLHDLTTDEALRRVGKVPFGRLVYFARALPKIWPTTHVVDDDMIVLNAHTDSMLCHALRTSPLDGIVTAYEVDVYDDVEHTGWCVVVTGRLDFLSEELVRARIAAADQRSRLPAWAEAEDIELLGLRVEIVTGYELGAADEVGALD